MAEFIDLAVEEAAMRASGMLGRGSGMGNSLFAIHYSNLPLEAHVTIQAIMTGGPFLYPDKDGTLYENRFGDLPSNANGEYREFTVKTPTFDAQGKEIEKPPRKKRRIISRQNGILFFTACHYERINGNMPREAKRSLTEQVDPDWRNGFYLITGITPDMRRSIVHGLGKIRNRFLPVPV